MAEISGVKGASELVMSGTRPTRGDRLSAGGAGSHSRLARGGSVRVFSLFLVLFFVALGTWSLATPLFGVPDEPVHEIKAVAVVRGELVGTPKGGPRSPNVLVTVPRLYAVAGTIPGCFAFKLTVPASCAKVPSGGAAPMNVVIYNGRYPPLYYALVGLPSLATVSVTGVYLMRLLSALLSATFLALAAMSIVRWSRSRVLLAGLALALTPTLLFLGGSINPSSLEISAAVCLWCSALLLVLECSEDPPPALVGIVGLAGSVTVLVRGLSPLWVGMIGLFVLALGPREVRALIGRRSVRLAAGCIVVCSGLATAWIVTQHSLDILSSGLGPPAHTSEVGILLAVFGRTPQFLAEMIGQFGWVNTPSPMYTYVTWYLGLGIVAGAAILFARGRQLAVLFGVTLAAIIVPVLISSSQVHQSGFVWQGKDTLPFAIGIPLVAAAIVAQSRKDLVRVPRLVGIIAAGTATAELAAFAEALRRNAVGLPGPLDYLRGPWHPPLGALSLTLVAVTVWCVLAVVFWRYALLAPVDANVCSSSTSDALPPWGAESSEPHEDH
ncbi:MAG: DUF2142 domain-containing protein [Acidimicrobiales bacterium]